MKINLNTVIVVDDEPEILELIKLEIEDMDYEVKTATNGVNALELIKKNNPFLVISDINMPKMDGIQLLNEVMNLQKPLPLVVLITGYAGYMKDDLLKKGVFSVLSKPFDFGIIENTVKDAEGIQLSKCSE